MNRSLATVSALFAVLALGAIAGCAAPAQEEDAAETGDALTAGILDEPAVTLTGAEQPKVVAVDLRRSGLDLSEYGLSGGAVDLSKLKIDVLDTRFQDDDSKTVGPKWVTRDRAQVPELVSSFTKGIDVGGGGRCRITTLSLKKVAVGCKWTW